MTWNRRVGVKAGVVVMALAVLQLPHAYMLASEPNSCEEMTAWAESNADIIPHTVEGFSTVSVAKRRALFRALSAGEKSELMQESLYRFRHEAFDRLTTEQIAVVDRAILLASPVTYSASATNKNSQEGLALSALDKSIRDLFPNMDDRRRFAMVGSDQVLESRLSKVAAAVSVTTLFAYKQNEWCDCSNDSDYCGYQQECGYDGNGCRTSNGGCGALLFYDCDGECVIILPS